jgi:hypothetical protein
MCDRSGQVCPHCQGMRFVRVRAWSTDHHVVEIMRCPSCTEGNQVNPAKEQRAIAGERAPARTRNGTQPYWAND